MPKTTSSADWNRATKSGTVVRQEGIAKEVALRKEMPPAPVDMLRVVSVPRGDEAWCHDLTWDELSLMAERGERGFALALVVYGMDRAPLNHAYLQESWDRLRNGKWTLYSQGWDATTPKEVAA